MYAQFLLLEKIGSLPRHIEELRIYLAPTKSIYILALNEKRLDDSVCSREISMYGFSLEIRGRNRNKGGVALKYHEVWAHARSQQ